MTAKTDAEIADAIERGIDGSDYISFMLHDADWRKIIAALRREPAVCPRCHGTGRILVSSFADHSKKIDKTCHICKGRGTLGEREPATEAVLEMAIAACRKWLKSREAQYYNWAMNGSDGSTEGNERDAVKHCIQAIRVLKGKGASQDEDAKR